MSGSLESVPGRSRFAILVAPNGCRHFLQDRPLVALSGVALLLVALIGIVSPGAITLDWVAGTLLFAVPLGIIAAGQNLVVLTAGIDLSLATVASAAGFVMATQSSVGDATAILIGLSVGIVVGLINGLGVAVFQVPPLIMTLGSGLVATGVLNVYAQRTVAAASVPQVPDVVRQLGRSRILGVIPYSVLFWAVLALVIIWGLRRTGFGRMVYAVGTNRVACRLAGVRVWQVLLVTYALAGLLAAVGGIVLSGTANVADRGLAEPLLLPSVAAVVIGGTSVFGGTGRYTGTIMGTLILTLLAGLLTVVNAPAAIERIVYGGIILFVAAGYARVVGER